jgi:hypothetical protein
MMRSRKLQIAVYYPPCSAPVSCLDSTSAAGRSRPGACQNAICQASLPAPGAANDDTGHHSPTTHYPLPRLPRVAQSIGDTSRFVSLDRSLHPSPSADGLCAHLRRLGSPCAPGSLALYRPVLPLPCIAALLPCCPAARLPCWPGALLPMVPAASRVARCCAVAAQTDKRNGCFNAESRPCLWRCGLLSRRKAGGRLDRGGLAPSTRQRHDGPGLEKTLRRRLLLSVFWARPTRRNWPAHCSTKSSDALPQPPHACLPRSFFSRCSAVRSVYVFVFVFTTR